MAQQNQIDKLLARAQRNFERKRWTVPKNDNAVNGYRAVLSRVEDHPTARARLQFMLERYRSQAEQAVERGQLSKAAGYLNKALLVQPDHDDTLRRQAKVEQLLAVELERDKDDRGSEVATLSPPPSPSDELVRQTIGNTDRQLAKIHDLIDQGALTGRYGAGAALADLDGEVHHPSGRHVYDLAFCGPGNRPLRRGARERGAFDAASDLLEPVANLRANLGVKQERRLETALAALEQARQTTQFHTQLERYLERAQLAEAEALLEQRGRRSRLCWSSAVRISSGSQAPTSARASASQRRTSATKPSTPSSRRFGSRPTIARLAPGWTISSASPLLAKT